MSEVIIDTENLEVLLNVTEGFIAENGIGAVDRYAPWEKVEEAVNRIRNSVRNAKRISIAEGNDYRKRRLNF